MLRAFAAAAVVVAHAQFDLTARSQAPGALPDLGWLKAGVDVFFVVSGFVMVYTAEPLFGTRNGAQVFLLRRFNRIVPLYWLLTTAYVAIALLDPALRHKGYSAAMIAASYLFVPFRSPDGFMEPIVGQGWTLNYEMAFYLLFTVAVVAARNVAVTLLSAILIVGIALGQLMRAEAPDAVAYWSSGIVLEFVFGMLLAIAYLAGLRLGNAIRFILIVGGIILVYAAFATGVSAGPYRALCWGVPAVMIVVGAAFGSRPRPAPGWQWVAGLGDASYALYLTHSLPVRTLGVVWIAAGLESGAGAWLYLVLALCGAIAAAVLVHRLIERPLNSVCRHLLFGAPKLRSAEA